MFRCILPACIVLHAAAAPLFAAELACEGVQGGHLGAAQICAEAGKALNSYNGPLTLQILRDDSGALSARLVAAGQPGPQVNVTSAERAMSLRDVKRLAEGLLRSSDLP